MKPFKRKKLRAIYAKHPYFWSNDFIRDNKIDIVIVKELKLKMSIADKIKYKTSNVLDKFKYEMINF